MATTQSYMHTPYQLTPATPPVKSHQYGIPHPSVAQKKKSHTRAVLQEIQAFGDGWASSSQFGWDVLRKLWDIEPASFDSAALKQLAAQPIHVQQHVLLTVATMDVQKVKNLSALMHTLTSENNAGKPVCLAYLAGLCYKGNECAFCHPIQALGWKTLECKWQVSWLDFDYSVMNVLLRKPLAMQDKILMRFSSMRLWSIHNLSAMLYSIITQFEKEEKQPCEVEVSDSAESPGSPFVLPPRHVSIKESGWCAASPPGNPEAMQAGSTQHIPHSVSATQPLAAKDAAHHPLKASALFQSHSPRPVVVAEHQPSGQTQCADGQAQGHTTGSCGTERVIQALLTCSAPSPRSGWDVLAMLWGIGRFNFAPDALRALRKQCIPVQEHILLSIAAMDLHQPYDLTGLLQTALTHTQQPVCWRYLAGLCSEDRCRFHHPPFLPAWDRLRSRGITHVHVEYAVLNVFLMLPATKQEHILTQLFCDRSLAVSTISELMLRIMEQNP
eukprot:GGOE01056899.1.p1 GENE.GGOE01056899.1~~GGOE01056899.1.p1  ORF type:complete len:508 (-),score=73.33 GGOE01056899.1:171-1667(-)